MILTTLAAVAVLAQQPAFTGLGSHTRKVTTNSSVAQRYFNQGLAFLYAFNHDEAIRLFTKATEADPKCAMAWWGIATANGPHINNPVVEEPNAKAAWNALQKAKANVLRGTKVEQMLIEAATKRFANPQPADRTPLDRAYADAMRRVWRAFPRDADVGALFAESMMDLRPWDLWTLDGKPQPGTNEIVATLQKVLSIDKDHPLGLHLYIHAVEASPKPELAHEAADRLRFLQPGLGHMVHMPSHMDVRLGNWQKAVEANERAIKADKTYRERSPNQGFYTIYMAHNRHMLSFAAMMNGQYAKASKTMDDMVALFPPEWLEQMAPLVDGYMAMPIEVRVRFGKWDEVLAAPDFPEHFPLARALRHAARGVSYAAMGMTMEARTEQSYFYQARAKVSKDAIFGNNNAHQILLVATHLLNGELLVAEGKTDAAIATLRKAVEEEDKIRYNEPPDWIQPVRHTLGAYLLKVGRYADAEAVYREDLRRLPNNGWSLYGLSAALEKQGRPSGAIKERFRQVWANADTKIDSSCLCIPGG